MPELQEGRYAGEFVVSEGNGRISREIITVLSGETLTAAAVLGKVTASGKYKVVDPAAVDGSEVAAGILYDAVDASAADAEGVAIVRLAEVNAAEAALEVTRAKLEDLKAKGVDEVWCVATNDGFVMAAWGKELGANGKIRFLGDGSAKWAKALGLELDLVERGMGVRLQRFSMLLEDGIVKQLNVEAPGKFEVSDADTLIGQLAG